MNREEFAKRLHAAVVPEGTPQEKIRTIMYPVSKAIFEMMPNSLFRYRSLNGSKSDEKQIEAFKNDIIYAVTADRFNDPYDTLVRYDKEAITQYVNIMTSCKSLEGLKTWFENGNELSDEVKRELPEGMAESFKENLLAVNDFSELENSIENSRSLMIAQVETYFPILSEMCKKYSAIACFSESVDSMLMWSHYANSHQGFALEYDFRPTLEKPISNVGIYPVIYDNVRQDVTQYMAWSFVRMMGIQAANPDCSMYLKIALHKSSVWSYEQEWRMINMTQRDITDKNPSTIQYKPVAIYYGHHISGNRKKELHQIAQEKGIREYEMYIDYSSEQYEMRYRNLD